MNPDVVSVLAAIVQGFHRTANDPITDHEAVHRAKGMYLETVRQLRDHTHRPEIPHE